MPKPCWALFLDLDGTLLDIAERPAAVVPPAGLIDALAGAAAILDDALAIVTGRSIAFLDGLLRPLRLAAAGQHGAELRLAPNLSIVQLPTEPLSPLVQKALVELARAFPGVELEDKGRSWALHYRAVPAAAEMLKYRLERILSGTNGALALASGKMVLEIRDKRYSKASAVDAFMREPAFAGRLPIFIGDDETDRDGFAAAKALGGKALRVGAEDAEFSDPAAVRAWLASLPDNLAQGKSP